MWGSFAASHFNRTPEFTHGVIGVPDDIAEETCPLRNMNGEPKFCFWRYTVRLIYEFEFHLFFRSYFIAWKQLSSAKTVGPSLSLSTSPQSNYAPSNYSGTRPPQLDPPTCTPCRYSKSSSSREFHAHKLAQLPAILRQLRLFQYHGDPQN